jgi:hypothetical protein
MTFQRRTGLSLRPRRDTDAAADIPACPDRLHLDAEMLAQRLEFLVAQPFEPSRAEDRRGGFLVPGADLTERRCSGYGVIEGELTVHG